MIRKIEAFTPAQEQDLPEFRAQWLEVGLCTDPADRPRAEAAIAAMYGAIDEAPPRFIWGDSPLECHLQMDLVEVELKQLPDLLQRRLRVPLKFPTQGQLRPRLPIQLADQLRSSLRDQLGEQLRLRLQIQLADQLRGSLPDQLDWPLQDLLWAQKVRFRSTFFAGQHDAYWVAYHRFCEAIGVCYPDRLRARLGWHEEVVRACGWWWPFRGICFLADRPSAVHMRDGRLHCEDGPAVAFRDGWSTYAIGGVQVDEQIVLRPETQTLAQLRSERNAEVKRIRIERFGWPRYLDEGGAHVLDARDNDIEATHEAVMRTTDGKTVLVCACPSTARVYALEVPSAVTTCAAAQAWLSGGLSGRIINAA
jgi:hypothetical protein